MVELRDSGQISIRLEPTDRPLKRNEQLPEMILDVGELAGNITGGPPLAGSDSLVEQILHKARLAKFEGIDNQRAEYALKVWLLRELEDLKDE